MSYYIPDDATEDELREMAVEQREARAAAFGLPAREVTLRPASRTASLVVAGLMLTAIVIVLSIVTLLMQQPPA